MVAGHERTRSRRKKSLEMCTYIQSFPGKAVQGSGREEREVKLSFFFLGMPRIVVYTVRFLCLEGRKAGFFIPVKTIAYVGYILRCATVHGRIKWGEQLRGLYRMSRRSACGGFPYSHLLFFAQPTISCRP